MHRGLALIQNRFFTTAYDFVVERRGDGEDLLTLLKEAVEARLVAVGAHEQLQAVNGA